MICQKRLDYLAVGVDSSNHGTDPEIFVAFASPYVTDTAIREQEKIRDPRRIARLLLKRNFDYLLATRVDYERFGEHKFIAHATASLVDGLGYYPEELEVYVDGEMTSDSVRLAKGLIAENLSIPSRAITITPVPKQKRNITNLLISLADAQAHSLFRHKTLKELTSGKISKRRAFLI